MAGILTIGDECGFGYFPDFEGNFRDFLRFLVKNTIFLTVDIGIKSCERRQRHPGFRNNIVRCVKNCIRGTKSPSFVFGDLGSTFSGWLESLL